MTDLSAQYLVRALEDAGISEQQHPAWKLACLEAAEQMLQDDHAQASEKLRQYQGHALNWPLGWHWHSKVEAIIRARLRLAQMRKGFLDEVTLAAIGTLDPWEKKGAG